MDPTLDADSSEPAIKQHSITAIKQELDWAGHLGLQACIVSLKSDNVHLAHILNQVSMQQLLCFESNTGSRFSALVQSTIPAQVNF